MTKSVEHNLMKSDTQYFRQAEHVASMVTALPSPYKDLTFPLNVYAHALLLQEGKATYLHYGLFQNNRTSLQAAQQFSTDLLMSRLPPPPCRVLEVGVGLGATFSLLKERGYAVHGITPDAQQIAYIQKSLGPDVSVSCHALETFTGESESFDIALFQESSQYIDPLVIFNKSLDLLSQSGQLFIIDEFRLKCDATSTSGSLHQLDSMIALAERSGFELIENLDLSSLAAPTLDYLLQTITTHRQKLIKDLFLHPEQLKQLEQSNRIYQEKYANGQYGYALLHFRKKTHPKWRLQLLEENQRHAMFDLFNKTFHQVMTPAIWQWKYGSSLSHEIGVWRENKLIAHYGGIARKILFFGQPQTAVQIGDVMVDTSERGTLSKKGPFFLMASTFLERYIGYGKPYLIGFGFPNERAMKVAERLGLYAEVGHMVEFSWRTRSRFPLWGTRLHLIHGKPTERTAAIVNACWQRMAADLRTAVIGVRDWQYLQHRYLNHPHHQYQIMLVTNRFSSRAHGILVLRYDAGDCEIVDIIAPLAEIPLLITHARRLAGIHGAARVFCHITGNFAAYFPASGESQRSVNIRIPANAWSEGPSPEILKDNWWLMSGDKDFR